MFTMKERYLCTMALLLVMTTFFSVSANEIDLELTTTFTDPSTTDPIDHRNLTFHLSNKGTSTATGVVVDIDFSNLHYFNNYYTLVLAHKGTYASGTGYWSIPTLNAGESATLHLNWILGAEHTAAQVFGQVISADQTDIDSTPNNNTTGIATEDDETGRTISANDGIAPTIFLRAPITDVSGDFKIEIYFSEPVKGLTANDFIVQNGEIIGLYDNPDQQYYSMDVRPISVGEIKISLPANTVQDFDGNPNSVSNEVIVNLGLPNDYIDLSLNMTASDTEIELFDNIVYTLEVKNDGVVAATNVLISFDYDAQFDEAPYVLVSQNVSTTEYDAWNGIWQIDALGVGESKILEVVFYAKANMYYTIFSEVLAADQIDIDSGYDNDFGETLDEDDEAKIAVKIGTGESRPTPELPIPDLHIGIVTNIDYYPNPATDILNININAEKPNIVKVLIANSLGQVFVDEDWDMNIGLNQKRLDILDLSSGIYFLTLHGSDGQLLEQTTIVKE